MQVNIIPIVAKSDAISKSELAKFKIKITSELVSNGVQIYQFPTDDESVAEINSTMNVSLRTLYPHHMLLHRICYLGHIRNDVEDNIDQTILPLI